MHTSQYNTEYIINTTQRRCQYKLDSFMRKPLVIFFSFNTLRALLQDALTAKIDLTRPGHTYLEAVASVCLSVDHVHQVVMLLFRLSITARPVVPRATALLKWSTEDTHKQLIEHTI